MFVHKVCNSFPSPTSSIRLYSAIWIWPSVIWRHMMLGHVKKKRTRKKARGRSLRKKSWRVSYQLIIILQYVEALLCIGGRGPIKRPLPSTTANSPSSVASASRKRRCEKRRRSSSSSVTSRSNSMNRWFRSSTKCEKETSSDPRTRGWSWMPSTSE